MRDRIGHKVHDGPLQITGIGTDLPRITRHIEHNILGKIRDQFGGVLQNRGKIHRLDLGLLGGLIQMHEGEQLIHEIIQLHHGAVDPLEMSVFLLRRCLGLRVIQREKNPGQGCS